MNAPVSVLVCDDHRLLTDAIASVIEANEGLRLVCEPVHTAADAIAAAAEHFPDVALMDIDLGAGPDGLDATRQLLTVSPATKVVVVSARQGPTVLLEAVEAGAVGFLDKNSAVDDVIQVVRDAAAGVPIIDAAALARQVPLLAASRRTDEGARSRLASLTRREREILHLMAQGLRTDAIAGRLVISPTTVRTHAQNILTKLQVHSQLEAVALVTRPDERRA